MRTRRFAAVMTSTLALTAGTAMAHVPVVAEITLNPAVSAHAAARDFSRLSTQGNQAFRDISLARIALFNGDPSVAAKLIKNARQSLRKAENDGTMLKKALSELKIAPNHGNPPASSAGTTTPIAWLPVEASMESIDDFSASPAKAAAIARANQHLQHGERDQAINTLRLANVNILYTIGLAPLSQTITDVSVADGLLTAGKYYEANQVLKRIQDSVQYIQQDFVGTPVKGASAPGGTASHATGPDSPAQHTTPVH